MATIRRYEITREPVATVDGSGIVIHDFRAVYSVDDGDSWIPVPNLHKNMCLPADELQVVLDMPAGGAKVQAYKALIVQHRNTFPEPYPIPPATDAAWVDPAGYHEAYLAALAAKDAINVTTAQVAADAHAYILSVAPDYPPVRFSL